MSEMLGNQYFLARKYTLAEIELGNALANDPENKGIRRKLIICHVQKGNIERAFKLFVSLVEDDIGFIANSDPNLDDCPCPELVYDLEAQIGSDTNSLDYNLRLGMLWLYCDIKKSIHYFEMCQKLSFGNSMIKKILSRLKTHLFMGKSS